MLDVGLIWDAKTTIKRAKSYEPYNLFWIEEPLHPDNYHGYGIVSDKCIQHIAAGEEECSISGFKNLIDFGNIDIVQIDVTRCGLTQAKKIADHVCKNKGGEGCFREFCDLILLSKFASKTKWY